MAATAVRKRDKKITILQVTYDQNEYGESVEKVEPLPGGENIWAFYRQASAEEFYAAYAVQYKVEAIFEIAWRDDLHNSMRILFRGKVYSITRIDDYEGYKKVLRISAYSLN